MASLSADARAARVEARRVRKDAQLLKLVVRGNLACSRERLDRAHSEADKVHALRHEPLPSPWSELLWAEAYETFDRTLVPLN